ANAESLHPQELLGGCHRTSQSAIRRQVVIGDRPSCFSAPSRSTMQDGGTPGVMPRLAGPRRVLPPPACGCGPQQEQPITLVGATTARGSGTDGNPLVGNAIGPA